MKPAESFLNQPIRSLQTMLRTIASIEPNQVNVMPDGIYGSQTAAAVSSFQRRMGLPITGVADQNTHEHIVREFEKANIEAQKAQPLQISLDAGQVLGRGQSHYLLFLVQSILTIIHLANPDIPAPPITGRLDRPTEEAIAAFQTYAELPPTGEVDKTTWKALAIHFALAADWLEFQEEL